VAVYQFSGHSAAVASGSRSRLAVSSFITRHCLSTTTICKRWHAYHQQPGRHDRSGIGGTVLVNSGWQWKSAPANQNGGTEIVSFGTLNRSSGGHGEVATETTIEKRD